MLSCLNSNRRVHEDIDDRVPYDGTLSKLQRKYREAQGDECWLSQNSSNTENGIGRPAKQEHEHQQANLTAEMVLWKDNLWML